MNREIENWYRKLLGAENRRAEYSLQSGETIAILKWMPEATKREVVVYATAGAYQFNHNRNVCCEFFVSLTESKDSIAENLADIAVDGRGDGRVPNDGDSITLVSALWIGSKFRSAMFRRPLIKIFPSIKVHDSKIEFIQVVPLYTEELAFKTKKGYQALIQLFTMQQIPFSDPDRKCADLL